MAAEEDGLFSKVTDDEILYRSISPENFICENGKMRLTSQAFADRAMRPSVDRAKICGNDPYHAKKSVNSGVVSILAAELRDEPVSIDHEQNGKLTYYIMDVIPDPVEKNEVEKIEKNKAHAVIIASPEYRNKSAFKKILERLARLAERRQWTLPPAQ